MISHKLNEITAIADTTTIIRDGRTVETLDMSAGEVTQERIIRGMVGRDLEHRFYPDRVSDARRRGAADRGLDRAAPDPGPQGRRRRQPVTCAPARSSGSPGSWAPAAPSSR